MDNSMQNDTRRILTPKEKRLRKKRIRKKLRLAIVIAGFVLIISAVVLPIVFFAAFRVKAITPDGYSTYTSQEIVAASGIESGKNLFFVDPEKVSEKIERELPYLDNVTIKRKLPNEIIIRFEQSDPTFAFKNASGIFIITNSSLKVLEMSVNVPDGVAVVNGVIPVAYEEGFDISFEANDKKNDTVLSLMTEISDAVEKCDLVGINEINLESLNNIYIVCEKRLVLKLGDTSDILSKLSLAKKVITKEDSISPSQYGTINLSVAKKAYFAPAEFNDIDELSKYAESSEEVNEDEDPQEESDED